MFQRAPCRFVPRPRWDPVDRRRKCSQLWVLAGHTQQPEPRPSSPHLRPKRPARAKSRRSWWWLGVDNSWWFGGLCVSVREVVGCVNSRYFERKRGEEALKKSRRFYKGLAYELSESDHSSDRPWLSRAPILAPIRASPLSH